MRNFLKLAVLSVAVALVAASPASGAVTIGETFAPTGNCSDDTSFLQSASPGSSYTVPTAGVLTSWSFRAPAAVYPIKLKVGNRVSGDSFQIDGESAFKTPIPNVLNTYPDIRIPVAPGDVIGFATGVVSFGSPLCSRAATGFDLHYRVGDEPPGAAQVWTQDFPAGQLNVSAVLEPDLDADGFGDESQDDCLGQNGPLNGCPAPPPPVDTDPPETTITKGARRKIHRPKVKFKFTADEPVELFQCRFTRRPFRAWRSCESPARFKHLRTGRQKFLVRAVDKRGNFDPTPAKDKFKVVG